MISATSMAPFTSTLVLVISQGSHMLAAVLSRNTVITINGMSAIVATHVDFLRSDGATTGLVSDRDIG